MKPLQLARASSALFVSVALAVSGGLVACSDDHDHDHDHDHGDQEHGHAHTPKFGGTLVELGDHFANLEFVHDAETGNLRVYVLDAHAEDVVASPTEELQAKFEVAGQEFTLALPADVSESKGNKVGASSLFEVTDERLKGVQNVEVEIAAISVKGTEFKGVEFGGDDHAEHGHDGEDHADHAEGEAHADHDDGEAHAEGEDHEHDHSHVHTAKFGGTLVELGDHFANLEFVHDAEFGNLRVYVLDAHAENVVPSPTESLTAKVEAGDQTFELTLAADTSVSKGNRVGATSLFEVTDERLKGVDHVEIEIATISVKGADFTGVKFHHGDHDH